ncbi:ABC transporter ATP-binding protein [Cytobacillus praedii]|uniref:ABC transporter ATP-binding protein n=1 Tax=Cytobacillus praedii TaxID=1742358 RepID=A0A4R1B3V4_9BACI|nr:ABC transporter ATP-binding protein [Cytobacillus praedii]TCJ04711.1 ABC transporter ATP-binding protein [Cytobacillus praedii]
MDVLLEFNSVSVSFYEEKVIENLSFSLKQGDVIALLGPSGCGKTTILNITSGLIDPTRGKVSLHTKKFGYVFQEPRLLPWRTVIDNILFVMREKNKTDKKQKAIEILRMVSLDHVANYYPSKLSGGMKQRVSIARALATHPELILMDEPFSALDPKLKYELQQDVIQLIDENHIGIIYVTHDPLEALRLADRIVVLSSQGCSIIHEMKIAKKRNERDYEFLTQVEIELRKWVGGI